VIPCRLSALPVTALRVHSSQNSMKFVLLYLFGALWLGAQPVSFGIKGGVPLTDFINAPSSLPPPFIVVFAYQTTTNRYLIGPTVEVRLSSRFALEADALYRRLNYGSETCSSGSGCTIGHTTGNNWEFPVLAKYHFAKKRARPFIDAGIAWDVLTGLHQTLTFLGPFTGNPSSVITSSHPFELLEKETNGFAIGGGADFHLLFVHITPEVRYTRWINQQFGGLSNQNQAEFLIGLTFGR
jgi:hypothetical protein